MENTTELVSACNSTHLTSFASGYFPKVNTIDFRAIWAKASFQDNMTIYLLLIFCFFFYFIFMIWATWRDIKDKKLLSTPFMRDNNPEDMYMYEIIVETGPLSDHGTTSNVYFILTGDEEDTGQRCFTDDERKLFRPGALDPFIMTTQVPLGDLRQLNIWQDNIGLSDFGAWYLLSVTILDVQTGVKTKFIADQWLAMESHPYEVRTAILSIYYSLILTRY